MLLIVPSCWLSLQRTVDKVERSVYWGLYPLKKSGKAAGTQEHKVVCKGLEALFTVQETPRVYFLGEEFLEAARELPGLIPWEQ